MATRRKPNTAPVLDNPEGEPTNRIVKALPENQFNSIIRCLLKGTSDQATLARNTCWDGLRALGIKAVRSRAVARVPAGSDHFSNKDLADWIARLGPDDDDAIDQLIVLHATAAARSR